jgi:hypothetical protein
VKRVRVAELEAEQYLAVLEREAQRFRRRRRALVAATGPGAGEHEALMVRACENSRQLYLDLAIEALLRRAERGLR